MRRIIIDSYLQNLFTICYWILTKMPSKKASDMLTKVRGLIYEHRSTNSLAGSERDPSYLKLLDLNPKQLNIIKRHSPIAL